MALTAEINRDRKRRRKPFKPDDFNPYTVKRPVPVKATVEQVANLLGATFQPSSCSASNFSPCPKSRAGAAYVELLTKDAASSKVCGRPRSDCNRSVLRRGCSAQD